MNIRDVLRPSIREQASAARQKPQKKTFVPQSSTDRLTLSRQALAYLQQQNQLAWEKPAETEGSSPLNILEKNRNREEKCQMIAARLRRGDKVPPEDEKYLMKHDPAFYLLALSQRKEKPNPKQWESVLNEEDLRELAEPTDSTETAHTTLPKSPVTSSV